MPTCLYGINDEGIGGIEYHRRQVWFCSHRERTGFFIADMETTMLHPENVRVISGDLLKLLGRGYSGRSTPRIVHIPNQNQRRNPSENQKSVQLTVETRKKVHVSSTHIYIIYVYIHTVRTPARLTTGLPRPWRGSVSRCQLSKYREMPAVLHVHGVLVYLP